MTRINSAISPEELCDQHLVAEYREIGRIGPLMRGRLDKPDPLKGKPEEFTLGKGHMLFFIDKGKYIRKRFESLCEEMRYRGFTVNLQWRDHWEQARHLDNDWEPSDTVRVILRQRIQDRMPKQPRYTRRERHEGIHRRR